MVVLTSLSSRWRISTSCARIFSVWWFFKAGWSLWGDSVLSARTRFFHVKIMPVCPCPKISGGLSSGTAELWNSASLNAELGSGPKMCGSSAHLHEKGSTSLWNFNNALDSPCRYVAPLDSHRATVGTQFRNLVLVERFLLLDSVSASGPFPLLRKLHPEKQNSAQLVPILEEP